MIGGFLWLPARPGKRIAICFFFCYNEWVFSDRKGRDGMTKRLLGRLLILLALLGALCIGAAATSWYDDESDLTSADTTTTSEDSSDAAAAFSDVPATQWYYEYVDKLYASGVVGGFPDGTFRPQSNVTTGQALKMILLAAGYAEPDPVSSHWARGYLDLALAQSILDRGDITDLDVPMTRGMVAKVAANALGLRRTDNTNYFSDTDDNYVHALNEYGIVGGYTDGTYKPNKQLTRAEISAIVCRIQDFLGLDNVADGKDDSDAEKNVPSDFKLRTTEQCIEYLKQAEGFSATAFWDYQQYSIGYGSRCKLHQYPDGITKEEADKLLREILYEFEQDLDAFIKKNSIKLSDQEYDALIAFTYNTGSEWMRSSRLATLLINGDYSDNEFASAMGIWCHVGSSDPQISSALITRRMREVNIFLYGNYGKSGETFCAVYFNTDIGTTVVDIAFYKKGSGFAPFFGADADDDEFLYWQTEDGATLEEGDTIDEDMTVRAVWRYNG